MFYVLISHASKNRKASRLYLYIFGKIGLNLGQVFINKYMRIDSADFLCKR